MLSNNDKRSIIDTMKEARMLDHGSYISGDEFRNYFGIKMPVMGKHSDFKSAELEELTCSGFLRDLLLNEGKYLKSEKDSYRILLPSENKEQVLSYMSQADKKLKRGIKLNKNTPVEHKIQTQDEVRMIMKRDQVKRHGS